MLLNNSFVICQFSNFWINNMTQSFHIFQLKLHVDFILSENVNEWVWYERMERSLLHT